MVYHHFNVFLLCSASLLPTSYASSNWSVGVVCPLSGANALTGATFLKGLQWWQTKVNAAGGIAWKDGTRHRVELVVRDTETNNTMAGELATSLAREGVDALVNCFTAHNIAINLAMKANNIRRVLIHCSGGTPAQYGDLALGVPRWPFQFGVMLPSDTYVVAFFRMVSVRVKQGLLTNTNTAFIYNRVNPFTKYTCESSVAHASSYGGVDVVLTESFDGEVNDDNNARIRRWIRQMKSLNVTILVGCTWLMDGLMLQQAIVEERLDLVANMITIAPTNPKWFEYFPRDPISGTSDGDYVLSPTQWHHTQRFPDTSSVGSTTEFANEFRSAAGAWPNYLLASCTGAGSILEHAMSKTSWDPFDLDSSSDKLRATIRDLMVSTVYGDVRFDRHNQNVGHEPAMIQILDSSQSSVLPESNSQDQIVLPMPTWQSRRGCPLGTFNNGQACIPCPMNFFSQTLDAIHCTTCPAGEDQSLTGQQTCNACAVGRFRTAGAEGGCEPCQAGRYSDAEHSVLCEACPQGKYKASLSADGCRKCSNGTYMDNIGAIACTLCPEGHFSSDEGKSQCSRCGIGEFQDMKGRTGCTRCNASMTTFGFGSLDRQDCGCVEGFIDVRDDNASFASCEKCGDGLTCPVFSTVDNLRSGLMVNGKVAKVEIGFMSTFSSPLSIFKCVPKDVCLGGTPGSCKGGLIGIPCSVCSDGLTWDGEKCEECTGWIIFAWISCFPIVLIVLIVAYYTMNDPITAMPSPQLATSCTLGLTVAFLQSMAIVASIFVPELPQGLSSFYQGMKIFIFDFDKYGFSCVSSNSVTFRYLLSVAIFPTCSALLGLFSLVSQLFAAKYRVQFAKLASTMGGATSLLFTTLVIVALQPFMCYSHPNGQTSLYNYPVVLCGSTDHRIMQAMGGILLSIALCFLSLTTLSAFRAPAWSRSSPSLIAAFKFLLCRFRMDRWAYGSILMFRGLFLALPLAVATDYPHLQILTVHFALLVFLVVQLMYWPWKVLVVNVLDMFLSCVLISMAGISGTFLPVTVDDLQNGFEACAYLMFLAAFLSLLFVVCVSCAQFIKHKLMGGMPENFILCLGSDPPREFLCDQLQSVGRRLGNIDSKALLPHLHDLHRNDFRTLIKCLTVLVLELDVPGDETHLIQRVSWKPRSTSQNSIDKPRSTSRNSMDKPRSQNSIDLVDVAHGESHGSAVTMVIPEQYGCTDRNGEEMKEIKDENVKGFSQDCRSRVLMLI